MALDRYTLGVEQDRGATTLVFAARTDAGEKVVVKLLSRALLDDARARARIPSDLALAIGFDHPNAERVHGAGNDDGFVWVEAELIDGTSLREIVDARGAVPMPHACRIVLDVLAGLGAAHGIGLLHRNLSPANILVGGAGTVKVVDFGLVADHLAATAWREIDGDAAYASPERARGEPVDARSDLFSVAVVLRELLTGHREPRTHDESSLGEGASRVPPYLAQVIDWALAPARDARPRTADEFAAVLQLAANRDLGADWRARASHVELLAPVPPAPRDEREFAAPADPEPEVTRASRLEGRRRQRHTRLRVAFVAGIAIAALAASAAAVALRPGSRPSLRDPAPTTRPAGNFAIGHTDARGTTSSAATRPAAATFDGAACPLVTAAEASEALGRAVTLSPTPDAPNDCSYLATTGIVGELTVDNGLTGLPATKADFDRFVNGTVGRQQTVDGLGERAMLVGDDSTAVLFVLHHGWVVQAAVMSGADVDAAAARLARVALTRIP